MSDKNIFGQKIGFDRTIIPQQSFDASKKIFDLTTNPFLK